MTGTGGGAAEVDAVAPREPVAAGPAPLPAGEARRPRRWLPTSIDPLWVFGSILFVLVWWGLARSAPSTILPGPASVVARIRLDFFAAPELAFYGLPDASLFNSMIYTGENVAIAMVIGATAGTLSGLLAARFRTIRAILEPIAMTAGTVPILVAAPFFLI